MKPAVPSNVQAVPSNVVATVRRMAGRPGRGFSAPWPDHPSDPAWAPTTVLPEPPPSRLPAGRGFAVNLWLCSDPALNPGEHRVTAKVRWGERVHSWAFAGPPSSVPVVAIATLPLVRPVAGPLSLELHLATPFEGRSKVLSACRYELTEDAVGVPFWSPSMPDE